MNALTEVAPRIVLIGIGATAAMDIWVLLLKRWNVPSLNLAYMGRWAGHWRHGKWSHDSIAKAAPVKGELALGWFLHYVIGIVFAGLLVGIFGLAWISNPALLPALCVGIGTVVAPFFIMQPAMGAGFASSKTPAPAMNRCKSLANHAVFGLGLYVTGVLLAWT